MNRPQLILALDVDNLAQAERLVNLLFPRVKIFKVGSQLFTACGPEAVKMIAKKGAQVFLDLKFHDIPNTVYSAVSCGLADSVFMITLHTQGGKKMLEAGLKAAEDKAKKLMIKRPFLLGVTILTSEDRQADTEKLVLARAGLAKEAGLDGVVCSVQEAVGIRKQLGKDFIIVSPGIRPSGYPGDDQSRVATIKQAIEAAVDFIVVGRPILKADNPLHAAEQILRELAC